MISTDGRQSFVNTFFSPFAIIRIHSLLMALSGTERPLGNVLFVDNPAPEGHVHRIDRFETGEACIASCYQFIIIVHC